MKNKKKSKESSAIVCALICFGAIFLIIGNIPNCCKMSAKDKGFMGEVSWSFNHGCMFKIEWKDTFYKRNCNGTLSKSEKEYCDTLIDEEFDWIPSYSYEDHYKDVCLVVLEKPNE